MILSDLNLGESGQVVGVTDFGEGDLVSRRLRNLGFVAGEEVVCVAIGPFGRDPLLFQIGFTRFALRKEEAGRVAIVAR